MVVQTGAEAGLVAAVSGSGLLVPKRAHQCSATHASRASGDPAFSGSQVLAAEKNILECEPFATPERKMTAEVRAPTVRQSSRVAAESAATTPAVAIESRAQKIR